MGYSQMITAGTDTHTSTTRYYAVNGRLVSDTTTTNTWYVIGDPGTINNLYVNVTNNSGTGNGSVQTFLNNAAGSCIAVTTAGATGIFEDTTNSDSVSAGGTIGYRYTRAGTGVFDVTVLAHSFYSTTANRSSVYIGNSESSGALASNSFNTLASDSSFVTTSETTGSKYTTRFGMTSSYLHARTGTNTRNSNTTFVSRLNGADGSQNVVYATTETGHKTDASNTDTLVPGDDFNYLGSLSAGTGSFNINIINSTLMSSDNKFLMLSGRTNGKAITFNTTTFVGISGDLNAPNTTETLATIRPRFNFNIGTLGLYVSANNISTSPTNVYVSENSATTALNISIATAATGLMENTINTLAVVGGTDTLAYRIETPNTSGSLTFKWIASVGDSTETAVTTSMKDVIYDGMIAFPR